MDNVLAILSILGLGILVALAGNEKKEAEYSYPASEYNLVLSETI